MTASRKDTALSRWEDEGGALPCGPQEALAAACEEEDIPALSDTELTQLRIRVIALENIVLSLLSKASDAQLEQVAAMAEVEAARAAILRRLAEPSYAFAKVEAKIDALIAGGGQ